MKVKQYIKEKQNNFHKKIWASNTDKDFIAHSLLHFIGSGASVQSKASKLEVNWNFFSLYSILGDEV